VVRCTSRNHRSRMPTDTTVPGGWSSNPALTVQVQGFTVNVDVRPEDAG